MYRTHWRLSGFIHRKCWGKQSRTKGCSLTTFSLGIRLSAYKHLCANDLGAFCGPKTRICSQLPEQSVDSRKQVAITWRLTHFRPTLTRPKRNKGKPLPNQLGSKLDQPHYVDSTVGGVHEAAVWELQSHIVEIRVHQIMSLRSTRLGCDPPSILGTHNQVSRVFFSI